MSVSQVVRRADISELTENLIKYHINAGHA